tara:strand:+ start:3347 stop:3694 length:348 start_codon:yes stop_codon:yes gene_type:complete
MKECSTCKQTKPLTEYHRKGDGRVKMCKKCRKDRGHHKSKRFKDGHYSVYYLPEHHYVGMTNSVRLRMIEHRSKNNRLTDNYEVIAVFKEAVEAHLFETRLHALGYNGFNYKEKK